MAIFNLPVLQPAPARERMSEDGGRRQWPWGTQSGGVMYLGSSHPIHPSIHPSLSSLGFFLGFERWTVIKRSPFSFNQSCLPRACALFLHASSVSLSLRAWVASMSRVLALGLACWDPSHGRARQCNAMECNYMGAWPAVSGLPGPRRLAYMLCLFLH